MAQLVRACEALPVVAVSPVQVDLWIETRLLDEHAGDLRVERSPVDLDADALGDVDGVHRRGHSVGVVARPRGLDQLYCITLGATSVFDGCQGACIMHSFKTVRIQGNNTCRLD